VAFNCFNIETRPNTSYLGVPVGAGRRTLIQLFVFPKESSLPFSEVIGGKCSVKPIANIRAEFSNTTEKFNFATERIDQSLFLHLRPSFFNVKEEHGTNEWQNIVSSDENQKQLEVVLSLSHPFPQSGTSQELHPNRAHPILFTQITSNLSTVISQNVVFPSWCLYNSQCFM